ncbi:MAG TPA: hypothetical protein VH643_09310 [Gemmataceae bacterium]
MTKHRIIWLVLGFLFCVEIGLLFGVKWFVPDWKRFLPPWSNGKPIPYWVQELDDFEDGPFYDSKKDVERQHAADNLGKLGASAKPAIPALIRAFKSRRPLTRPYSGGRFSSGDGTPEAASEALAKIGPDAIPALTAALTDPDALTRVYAARTLWKLKKNSANLMSVLITAWRDKETFRRDECVRIAATVTLGEIGFVEPMKILPILSEGMQDDDEEIVYGAMRSLAVMAPRVKAANVIIVNALNDPRERVRTRAASILRENGDGIMALMWNTPNVSAW